MDEDPAFYEKFSKLIQQAIDDFRASRISDLEYLNKVTEIREKVANRQHDDMPVMLDGNEDAMALYGIIKPYFEQHIQDAVHSENVTAEAAIAIQGILQRHWKVQFWDDSDAQKRAMNDIDDYLYDHIKSDRAIDLSLEQMDEIIGRTMQVARHRMHG